MASGIVAKKIALFEIKPNSFEQQCRLKRKHAIRRKKYRGKERRVVTHEGTSMIALSTSEEHLNQLKGSDEDIPTSIHHQPCSSQFSASCSALFDLVSVESSSDSGTMIEDKTQMEIIPRSKRVVLKSTSIENFSKRLNIIDIDIEIKIEKKEQRSRSPSIDITSCSEEYEPLLELDSVPANNFHGSTKSAPGAPVAVTTTDRIRLKASLEDDSNAEARLANYYCLKCSHSSSADYQQINKGSKKNKKNSIKNNKEDHNGKSSPEPLYENVFTCAPPPPVSLGAPPLPPKRLFGDSFTTNYSCLPAAYSKERKNAQITNNKENDDGTSSTEETSVSFKTKGTAAAFETETTIIKEKNEGENKSSADNDAHNKLTIETTTAGSTSDEEIRNTDHVTDLSGAGGNLGNLLLLATTRTTKEDTTTNSDAICLDNEPLENGDEEEEPFYEDLYDYCNGSENGNNSNNTSAAALIDPLLELFRDQLTSLEQNVEDDVEYSDCSTILAKTSTTTTTIDGKINSDLRPKVALVGEHEATLRPDEIYDDCFGVETTQNPSCNNGNAASKAYCDATNDGGIACLTKYGNKGKSVTGSPAIATLTASHILNEYIKSKVTTTKGATPGWRNVTSSAESTKKAITSSSSPPAPITSSALLSVFSSLSASKTKLPDNYESEECVQNQTSTSQQVIAENERNVNKTKKSTASNSCTYALHSNHNGNLSKPRFGGRPVVAHLVESGDAAVVGDEVDQVRNKKGENEYQEHLGHKQNKKDDNEIFNKPLPLPPSNASTYESLYEEPIYGITNQLTATYSDGGKSGGGGSPGKRRSSAPSTPFTASKTTTNNAKSGGSLYSHSPSVSSGSTYGYSSGSINEYGDSGSASKYGPSSCQTVVSSSSTGASASTSSAVDGMSIYGINDKLPPTPPSKFSSIAKTAGRKIARKFLGIRKTSKCGLDEGPPPFGTSVMDSLDALANNHDDVSQNEYQGSRRASNPAVTNHNGKHAHANSANTNNGSVGGAQIRKPISRPNIPPPEPPKNEGGNMGPALSENNVSSNYNIYDKKNEDDYDDSDFYDSDSELIRNFVSQVQPIYSMEEEPLYQYYTYGISLKPDDDYQPVIPKNLGLTLDMLVPRVGQRTLWCELPGVVSSGILSILSDKQKQLQEAIFEILTSEVSYLKSLDVLITLFYKNEELIGVLTEEERGYLFGNIEDVRDCSQSFLSELLGKWEESWYIQEIGEIISRNTESRFAVYKEYCRNKPYQDKAMQRLRHSRDEFVSVVKTLEEDVKCQMLQIDSFLMLPMQRITRLPLLVNAVIQRTAAGKEKCKCEEALKCLTNLVLSCNDAARESQDAEETMAILEKLEFTRGIKALPDLGPFIMKGDFMKNPFDQGRGNQINWTFRKAKRTFYWLLLFSKQLLVARRKANGRYEIMDMIDPLESSIKALPNLEGVSKDFKHFFMLHFSRKETVYFLAARTNSEVERWKSKLDAMKPKEELRVEAIFPYDARRPDEMSFYVGDVIRVSQMQPDGWYYGTKLATGESGWFPGNYCCENAT